MRRRVDSGEGEPAGGDPATAKPHTDPRKGSPDPTEDTPGASAVPAVTSGTELIRLRADAPLRPPDWRARLASAIARHPERRVAEELNTWADDAVEEVVRLDRRGLDRAHPLAEARALLEPDRRFQRLEVEARLLAGQPASEIAMATGVGAGAVRWHHDAQYHCADRLGARGYIVHLFLGTVPPTGDPDGPPIEWARWYGYFGGVAMLEPLLDAFRHWADDRRPARGGTAAELTRRARRLRVRAAVMARSLAVTDLRGTEVRALLALAARREREPPAR